MFQSFSSYTANDMIIAVMARIKTDFEYAMRRMQTYFRMKCSNQNKIDILMNAENEMNASNAQ